MDRPTGAGGNDPAGGSSGGTTPQGGYTPPPPGNYQPGSYQPGGPVGGPGAPGGPIGGPGGYPPGYRGGPPPGPPPENNLVMAIISIFCCWPLGIPAIIFATQVQGKWSMGDFAGAQDSANKARTFAMISIILGLVLTALYVVLIVAGVATFGFTATTFNR